MAKVASPPPRPAEALTARFYAWERRARGWDVMPYPTVLEPPFEPFFHELPYLPSGFDDGRRPGLWDLFCRLVGLQRRDTGPADDDELPWPMEPLFDERLSGRNGEDGVVELRVQVPENLDASSEVAERVLLALGDLDEPVSFELFRSAGTTALQVAVAQDDAGPARDIFDAFVPEAVVTETTGALRHAWETADQGGTVVVDFGLGRESVLPSQTFRSLTVDPLQGFVAALHGLITGELGLMQVRFARTAYPWGESMLRAVSDDEGRAFFADAPSMLPLTREKTSRPLFACGIRVAARAATHARAFAIAQRVGRALSVLSDPSGNELIALSNDDYPDHVHAEDVLRRQSHRSGMILSAAELTGIVHLPGPSVRTEGLRAPERRTAPAPAVASSGQVCLGTNVHRGSKRLVSLPRELRLRHTHVVGATGTGKSTLLLSLIRQDIEAGRGVGLIDPHGDLVDDLLEVIPESRHGDVVLFDPADEECPVGLNILQAHSDREKDLLASDLVASFRRLSTSWGDQMTAVLGNAVMAFLESPEAGTLLDLRRFLIDKAFREERLRSVQDPAVRSFFVEDFPRLYGRPQTPILTRLDAFLRPKQIRSVVAQTHANLDLGAVIRDGKIFLARLAQGAIGEENAALLGSLLVSKFHQVALGRDRVPTSERRDFFLYLDEFHHFATPSLSALLAGARKFHVGLVLAHQELRQIGDRTLEAAVLTNPATRVCFRLGDDDARKLSDGFTGFRATDLQSLGVGQAICRIERADQCCNVAIVPGDVPERELRERRCHAIRGLSRRTYGTPRVEIEALVERSFASRSRHADVGQLPQLPLEAADSAERGTRKVQRPEHAPVQKATIDDLGSIGNRHARPASVHALARADSAGRGGPEHKYLQALIKRYGEDRGFRATIEAPVEGGGRVDVLLARDDLTVACEISISSSPAHEVENLKKCHEGGYSHLVLVSPSRRTLRAVGKLLKAGPIGQGVDLCTPDELLALLDSLAMPPADNERVVRGYRVKTRVQAPDRRDQARRRAAVVGTVVGALKRLRGR